MTKEIANLILERLTEEGYEATLHEGYSGRGMYGNHTTGVVLRLAYDWERACKDVPELAPMHTDSMGKGVIFY